MPDTGLPPPALPASHTSTHEWQSFEMRMRRRRAQRCVLRAQVALDAGFEEDARAALAEARRLDSSSPDVAMLRALLLEDRAREEAKRRADYVRRVRLFAAAAFLAVGTAAGALLVRGDAAATSPAAEHLGEAEGGTAGTTGNHAPSDSEPIGSDPPENGRTSADARAAEEEEKAPAEKKATAEEKSVSQRQPVVPETVLAPVPPAPQNRHAAEPASLDNSAASAAPLPAVLDVSARPTPLPAIPVSTSVTDLPGTPAAPTPALHELPAPKPPPSEAPADEPLVRAVLARYESAYSSLDAWAAQAVWPGVDAASLARAFDSLASQQVSLGRCRVSVDGGSATANCAGSATWTPKVGGGTRTEARQWRFDLAKAGNGWQIVRAEAR